MFALTGGAKAPGGGAATELPKSSTDDRGRSIDDVPVFSVAVS